MADRINMHTHSTHSDGVNTLDENIQEAIKRGFTAIGFSDHSYTAFDGYGCKDYRKYVDEVNEMKEKYRGKINVYCGMEVDSWTDIEDIFDELDYRIGSVHSINVNGNYYQVDSGVEVQIEAVENVFGGDQQRLVEEYYKEVTKNIRRLRPDIIGHFDLLTIFGYIKDTKEYREVALETVRNVIQYCNVFEVNTGGMARGRSDHPYPADFLLKEIKRLGGHVLLSSDAHEKEHLDFKFDDMLEKIRSLGYDHIAKFNGKEFVTDRI